MADWEEIKRLAADFQKVQLSSTSQKLSERNCIEIISYLKNKKIIDLVFTVDGKEFLTPSQLVQDIRNELYASGGRINLVELAKIIGVDLAHITVHLKDVLKGQRDIHSILGQLIDSTYITKIAGEINEKLVQQGQVNIADLTIQYDLPAEFLQQHVFDRHLGKTILGKQDTSDPRVFFTESFIARCKARIKGALAGLTKPTPAASILNHINISEKLFFSLFDQVVNYGTLTSRTAGAQYIPNVYARSQNEWAKNFYRQNGYLEYDALVRLGISDYKSYVKKQLGNEDLVYLKSCVISKTILERVEADVDECISSKSHIDMQTNLPSVFNAEDVRLILESVLTKQKEQQTIVIESFVISKAFVENLSKKFSEMVRNESKSAVESGRYQQFYTDFHSQKAHKVDEFEEKVDKREERRKKAAGGKTGGGTQGRETKTKSTKKSKAKQIEEQEETIIVEKKKTLEIFSSEAITPIILKELEDEGLDELVDPLTQYLLPKLNAEALEMAAEIYASTVADQTANRRQTHNEIQNKVNALVGDVRLFEKGLKLLPEEVQGQLVKYLLKTVCTDVVNEILNYISAEQNLNVVANAFNNDQRVKFVNDLPLELKKAVLPLVKTLIGSSVDDFMGAVETALSACSMIIKKIDKKKDRTLVLNYKHTLLEQLNQCEDLALVLHLATVVIFCTATQCMLHASGRHIASILVYLKPFLSEEQSMELTSYHDFVTLMLSAGTEAENAKEKLKEKVSIIKNIVNGFKKCGTSEKS